VEIANQGQVRQVRYTGGLVPGRVWAVPLQGGEEYRISCPFCSDKKFRLYVNHCYGVFDPETESFNHHLFHCFNDGCERDAAVRDRFQVLVYASRFRMPRQPGPVVPAAWRVADAPPKEVKLPDGLVPVHNLPAAHPAVAYLLERRFDLQELG